MIRFVTHKGM